ncbi:MAG: M20/M25/M40 family metallo-hydrolase, partial [Acidobacteria bacterium]|nr:M20/M25/M40 family metallo-hydrolase [Acidobacteriota bacterium]
MSEVNAEQIFSKLVSFDTTSSRSNLPLADYVCELLDDVSGTVVRDVSADGTKTNLMIRVGPELDEHRRGIVLSGHMDTVPAVEPSWQSDPFELHDGDDRWIARGSSDMKGFLALAIDLVRRTDPRELKAPIVLLLTYDEEVGTLGARHWVDHHGSTSLPRSAIIGEPTELHVVRMHKGHLKLRVKVSGVSAHSGYPHLGVNAIERAGRVISELTRLRIALESERSADSEAFEPVPWVPLNLGEIHGGTAINIIPDQCEITIGLRLL